MRDAKAAARIRRKYRVVAPELTDPTLLTALMALIEPATRGDPDSPLRWTRKSTAKLHQHDPDQLDRGHDRGCQHGEQ